MKARQRQLKGRDQNIREKYISNVQHEFMSNYYLSKYDQHMSKYHHQTNPQGTYPENSDNYSLSSEKYYAENGRFANTTNKKGRINFKAVLLDKKRQRSKVHQKSNSPKKSFLAQKFIYESPTRKNFKHEVETKNSKEKQSKRNEENFRKLEGSIINQLFTPSPSKIEGTKKVNIEIQKKTTYDENKEIPFVFYGNSDQDNVHIFKEKQEDKYQVIEEYEQFQYPKKEQYFSINSQKEKQEMNQIQSGIRSSFQRRNSRSKSTGPKRKRVNEKIVEIVKKNEKNFDYYQQQHYKTTPQPEQNEHRENQKLVYEQESLFYQNIRPQFLQMNKHANIKQKTPSQSGGKSRHSESKLSFEMKKQMRPPVQSESASKRFSSNKSVSKNIREASEDKKSERSYQDSLNEAPLSKTKQQYDYESRQNHKRPQSGSKTNRSNDKPPTQLRQSMHELSMISRFSMTSDEGGYIREHLEQEINQNQLGPYQQALTNLKDLIDQFPNAWPIYVVGQRILEDREQYDNKRQIQNQEMRHLQNKISSVNQKIRKRQQMATDVDNNSRTILFLVRKLASELEAK